MTVHRFFNPDLVEQLAVCGITARRRPPGVAATGFVLEGQRGQPRARAAVTNVVAVHSQVTITGPRQSTAPPALLALPASTATEPQTALELAEECARLRRDNQRLTDEVTRLRSEAARLAGTGTSGPQHREHDNDDSVKRFALLELD